MSHLRIFQGRAIQDVDCYFSTEAYRLSESQIDELNKGDSFSNSSLRRKLFGNDSGSSDSLEVSNNTPDKNTHVPSTDCWDSPPLVCTA